MIKIIIADVHKIIRVGLKMILKAEPDFKVVAEAQNEIELLQKADSYAYDILLLDVDMHGKKGLDLIREVKKINPKLPILALSIHPEDKSALVFLKGGASGYVCKDNATESLVTAIRTVISHGRYLSEELKEEMAFNILPEKNSRPRHEQLSGREQETLRLLASGKSVKDIAEDLELSVSTVFTYRGRIFEKLQIRNNVELIHYAIENDLVELKSMLA
jgi:DNA-binding NarL/FixJ family response regulator